MRRSPEPELHRDLLMLGHQRILVLEPTLVAVRDTLRLLGLPNGPLQVHRGLLVLNRLHRPGDAHAPAGRGCAEDEGRYRDPGSAEAWWRMPRRIGEPAALHGKFYKGIVALAAQAAAAFPVDSSPDGTSASVRRGWRHPWPVRHVSEEAPVWFGRRQTVVAAAPVKEAEPPPSPTPRLPPGAAIVELRTLCLGEMDPTSLAKLTPEELTQEVERTLAEIATQRRIQLNGREQRALARELVNDMLGLGPLEPLLEDDSITDIMVNGPERVFVERRGKLDLSGVRFRDATHVAHVCQRIAAAVGRRIDESTPMVDARLKDGSRVNIVFPPLALDGPYISIRKFSRHRIDFARLIEFGSMTRRLRACSKMASRARLNVIISGGTGSGKTTLLNALSRLIDIGERIVTIEDAAELQLQQPHVVRLETRTASLEGRGEVTQRDLVRNALRMRPDRIIVGEVRGSRGIRHAAGDEHRP